MSRLEENMNRERNVMIILGLMISAVIKKILNKIFLSMKMTHSKLYLISFTRGGT